MRQGKGQAPTEIDPNNMVCTVCRRRINPNDPVKWRPGKYLAHVICWAKARKQGLL